jgi:MFS family permease
MLPAMVGFGLFTIGTALSKNATSIFITRFLGGVFGSAPVSNVGAALGDFYDAKYRGIAVTFYAVMVVGGPCVSPVIGAAVTNNPHMGWRWTMWIQAIIVFTAAAVALFGYPETYGPVLLKRKAIRLRKETGDDRYWHPHEEVKMNLNNILTKHISRPLR